MEPRISFVTHGVSDFKRAPLNTVFGCGETKHFMTTEEVKLWI
jgi:hypothetical protein